MVRKPLSKAAQLLGLKAANFKAMSVYDLNHAAQANRSTKTGLHLIWKVLLNAARAARKNGNVAEAVHLYEQTLKAAREFAGTSSDELRKIEDELTSLSNATRPQEDYAIENIVESVVADAAIEADLETIWHDYRTCAENFKRERKHVEAENMWKAALNEAREFQADDPRIARTLEGLAEVLWLQHKYEEAQHHCEQLLIFYETHFGADDFQIGVVANNIALLSQFQRNYGAAEKHYKRAIAIRVNLFGNKHPDVLSVLANYANLLQLLNRNTEAETLREKALGSGSGKWARSGQWQAYAPVRDGTANNPVSLSVEKRASDQSLSGWTQLRSRAVSLAASGNDLAALKVWQEALTVYEKMMSEGDPRLVVTLDGIADCLCNLGRYKEAEPVLERAIYLKRRNQSVHPAILAKSILRLAKLYYLEGKYEQAEPALRTYIDIYKSSPNALTEMAVGYYNIAQLELAQGNYENAEEAYQKVAAIRTETLGSEHPHTKAIEATLRKLARMKARRPNGI